MEPLLYLLLVIAALVLAAVLWRLFTKPPRPPFSKRRSLLTAAEMQFYRVLAQAIPQGLAVIPKVRLMDVVDVPQGYWKAFGGRGSGMHLDFVLADAASLEPLLAIELDDRSHASPQAQERDAFKDAALASAGVPLLRVRVAREYHAGGVANRIKEALAKAY